VDQKVRSFLQTLFSQTKPQAGAATKPTDLVDPWK